MTEAIWRLEFYDGQWEGQPYNKLHSEKTLDKEIQRAFTEYGKKPKFWLKVTREQ